MPSARPRSTGQQRLDRGNGTRREEFAAEFRESPIKRAKRRAVKRNAAVALGNVGMERDADMLARALGDEGPRACECMRFSPRMRFVTISDEYRASVPGHSAGHRGCGA